MTLRQYSLGLFWFILNLVVSAFNDTTVKFLGTKLPFPEIAFLRFSLGALFLIPFILYFGLSSVQTSHKLIHLIRGALVFIAINMWAWGMSTVPISTVTVISFTLPLFILVLAYIFLKEEISTQLWIATFIGCIGIYITLAPYVSFNPACLSLIVATLMFATLDVINKSFIVRESMLSMLFYSTSISGLLGVYPAYTVWIVPTTQDVILAMVLGIGSNLILYCILRAFSYVPASVVAPYRYLELLLSATLGYALFNEVPSINVYAGCAIIIPVSLFISWSYTKSATKE
ncbi:DMT family transporter [Rickettsiales endosymbiont of Peranema trichophorum]|uniref:DMT family transporter n=1 Tax=Rickettsiales endosymbiont of Peranema trichophorum TaxID=2486577 RepID=UPI00102357D6|nr:DMT family transporter [Rickettsiales endosymbiont of Peranema trichophorum]RZI47743.1 DMT family transporter [Rickettsiales endosymbiont of Peranema trichophorum]